MFGIKEAALMKCIACINKISMYKQTPLMESASASTNHVQLLTTDSEETNRVYKDSSCSNKPNPKRTMHWVMMVWMNNCLNKKITVIVKSSSHHRSGYSNQLYSTNLERLHCQGKSKCGKETNIRDGTTNMEPRPTKCIHYILALTTKLQIEIPRLNSEIISVAIE